MNALLEEKVKFLPNWLGPYIVIEVYGLGAYKIVDVEGTPLKELINAMHLHRYYALSSSLCLFLSLYNLFSLLAPFISSNWIIC